MTVKINSSQAPTYSGEILDELQLMSLRMTCYEQTDGSSNLVCPVTLTFNEYGRTVANNRVYNKGPSLQDEKIVIDNIIKYAETQAMQGNFVAAEYLIAAEKLFASLVSQLKPQYSTAVYQED